MGRPRNLRLPEEMENDVDKYLIDNNVRFTDLVISGIAAIIYQNVKKPVKTIVYEPDPVKPVKPPKQSVSKQVAPVVANLLSDINRRVTIQHHPSCKCGMCSAHKS